MKKKNKWLKAFKEDRELLTMCLPAIIKILIFSYLPMIGIIIAFKNYIPSKGIFGSEWNGVKNFEFFFKSSDAWRVLRNTIGINFINIVLGLVFSVVFALLLYEITSKKLLKVYQTILFFPYFFSWVLVGLMITTLLQTPSGLLTNLIHTITGLDINFYAEPVYWTFIIPIISIWKGIGFGSLIYYAVLMGIDNEQFEAAELDGASRLQVMKSISIPTLIPMMCVLTILGIGGIIKSDFGLFYFVPRNLGVLYPTTDVIDTYVFRALTQNGDFGMSSAVGVFQSFVGFILIIITNKIAKSVDSNYSLF